MTYSFFYAAGGHRPFARKYIEYIQKTFGSEHFLWSCFGFIYVWQELDPNFFKTSIEYCILVLEFVDEIIKAQHRFIVLRLVVAARFLKKS